MGKKSILASLILMVAFLGSCSPERSEQTATETAPAVLPAGDWQLAEMLSGGKQVALNPNLPVALRIEANRISGKAPCNQYNANVETGPGESLHVGAIAATKMMCPEAMEQEQLYLEALGHISHFRVESGKLELSSDSGDLSLRFVAKP